MEPTTSHHSYSNYLNQIHPQIASTDLGMTMTTYQSVYYHHEIMLILGHPDGTVMEVNPASQSILGYTYEEFSKLHIESIIHAESRDYFLEWFRTTVPAGSKFATFKLVAKDGHEINASLTLTFIYTDNASVRFHILGYITDTAQTAIDTIENFQTSWMLVQDVAHVGHWTWNASTDELYWSEGIFHILGIPVYQDNLTTKRLGSFIHPNERDKIINLLYDTLHNHSSYQVTYHIVCPKGERTILEHARTLIDKAGHMRMVGIIQDITESVSIQKEQFRLNSVIQSSPHFVATISPRGKLLYVNHSGRKLLGISENEDILSMSAFHFLGTRDPKKCKCLTAMSLMDKNPWSGECAFTTRTGGTIPVSLTVIGHRDNTGTIESFSVIARNIMDQKRLESKIQHQTFHDALTGLPNRTLLIHELKQMTDNLHSASFRGAVVFIDLDDFKQINDALGHTTGDLILVEVAIRLKKCTGPSNFVARWGGDEFVIILQDIENVMRVTHVVRQIVQIIEETIYVHGEEFRITPSIGISLYPNDGFDSEALIKNADLAMYHAKRQTGKTYEYYAPSMSEDELERMTIRHELQKALTRNELVVYYQPLMDAQTLCLVGAEALIRWQHPAKGLIPPIRFIPIAEETGLIAEIDSFVVQHVCEQIQKWNAQSTKQFRVAVNISAKQFDDDSFIRVLERAVGQMNPKSLELEITESAIMKNERETIEKLKRIRGIGVKLSLDDFGTGYSSLNYLRLFSTDTIKIDLAFVNEITTKPEVAAITKSLIELAHALSMKVVAEGVETQDQLELLRAFGCDIVQGYLFSKPLPLIDFEKRYLMKSS